MNTEFKTETAYKGLRLGCLEMPDIVAVIMPFKGKQEDGERERENAK